jgi:hypothetical protein
VLTILGDRDERFCDGVSRRGFLRAGVLGFGSLGLGALGLGDVLRIRAQAAATNTLGGTASGRKTSVIFIELAGGPSQFETYDPKPLAPVEYRGPFASIATNIPGERFCELLPQQATMLDRLTVIRSIHHPKNSHDPSSHLSQTGYYKTGPKGGVNQMPSFGAVATRLRGANADAMPAYVAVPGVMRNGGSAHLGKGCGPFVTGGDPNKADFAIKNLTLAKGFSAARLGDRGLVGVGVNGALDVAGEHLAGERVELVERDAIVEVGRAAGGDIEVAVLDQQGTVDRPHRF